MNNLFPFETPASVVGADGRSLQIEACIPASQIEIQELSREIGKSLPTELEHLLRHSNGLNFYGIPIHGTSEMYTTSTGQLVLHDWGTGDVDCVDCDTGQIIFLGHDPFPELIVAPSLMHWFRLVMEDIQRFGALFDVYASVANGVDSLYGRAARQDS